ncbi:MAG: hypothetical protein AAGC43_04635 [Bacteroidota bacterium]
METIEITIIEGGGSGVPQTLSLSGNTLSISGGNSVSIPSTGGPSISSADDIAEGTNNKFLTQAERDAISNNSDKVGITPTQANAITTNSSKVGITSTQASNIVTNSNKVGYDDTLVDTYISSNQTKSNKVLLESVGGVIDWTGDEGDLYEIVLYEDTVLNNPSNPIDGSAFLIRVKQNPVGGFTITYGSDFSWINGGVEPSNTLDPDGKDYISVVVDGTKLDCTNGPNFL